jgi:serine/threonine protein kinase
MSTTTTIFRETVTRMVDGRPAAHPPNELLPRYTNILEQGRCAWTEHHHFAKLLGSGGQGVVYLTQRRGADDFTLPVAVKIFSPERYPDARSYDEAMRRIAHVAARVALIQQDNLLDVHNFLDRNRIRLMEMEWVDGYDMRRLLTNKMLVRAEQRVSHKRWGYINNVIVTAGPVQPRLKPGIAMSVCRECLAALAALHREGIVHGDVKPSNIMLKRTGNAKVIDIGSAFDLDEAPSRRTCTPPYAAPEVLEGAESTPRSDLCSLGYVLIEMLAGIPPFPERCTLSELLEAKRRLIYRLEEILPTDVARDELLLHFCRGLISPDPMRRFSTAEEADFQHHGAANFHRQLVKGDLASEYQNEIRLWLEELD